MLNLLNLNTELDYTLAAKIMDNIHNCVVGLSSPSGDTAIEG